MSEAHGTGTGSFGITSPVHSQLRSVEEDRIPVRSIDLKHLKRDIKCLPEPSGKFYSASSGFGGFAISAFLQLFSLDSGQMPFWVNLVVGLCFAVIAAVFFALGFLSGKERKTQVDNILENIDDYSSGVIGD